MTTIDTQRSDALSVALRILCLRDPRGISQAYKAARGWLQAVRLLVESQSDWHDTALLSCIDHRIARFQAEARQIQQQQPYQGVLPESEALEMATLLNACEDGSPALRAPLATIIGPFQEALIAALEAPDDADRAQRASQLFVEAIRTLKRDIAEQEVVR